MFPSFGSVTRWGHAAPSAFFVYMPAPYPLRVFERFMKDGVAAKGSRLEGLPGDA